MKKKIKWGNVLKAVVLVACVISILCDACTLIFTVGGFTWFGLCTHILKWVVAGFIYCDLEEQFENL